MSEVAQLSLLEVYLQTHSEKPDTVHVPMPWDPLETAEPDVTDEERAELRAYLAAHSAIANS